MSADKKMTIEEAAEKGLLSADVAQEKRDSLKQLFPEVFTEDTIDFDQLRRVMGDWVEPGKERYGLNWPGKAECMKVIQAPSIATLKPAREESVNFDETENLFIEGDNLEVLKLLQKAYFGKIKMIYIDPPYNTGKEFIYPDKYQENLDTYLNYTDQVDEEGKKFATNTDAGGRYHSNWLNMMYPRLYLVRNLLREDGMIFVSIDDNEQSNLKLLMDLIFGAENFVECFIWKKSYGGGPKEKYAVTQHEYTLMYAKSMADLPPFLLPYDPKKVERYYKGKDKYFPTRGPFRIKPLEATKSMDSRPNLVYGIQTQGGEIWPKRQWLWSKDRVVSALEKEEVIVVGEGENKTLNYKQYLKDESGEERGEKPFSVIDGIYTQRGTEDLRSLFDGDALVQFPKPVDLISKFVSIAASALSKEDTLVLDFFSGSSTTAEAALRNNVKHGTSTKFVLVQLPELCDEDSAAHKAGFQNIADIGKERIRRVITNIEQNTADQLELDDESDQDLGFKVFKLDQSNFNLWNGDIEKAEDLANQLELHVDHIDQESSPEDILYELLLKAGFELTTKVEKKTMAGKDVYAVSDGAMLICLDKAITSELIDALADANPLQVICLDEGFKGNDQLKTNAVQTFKSRAKEDDDAIVFRTV